MNLDASLSAILAAHPRHVLYGLFVDSAVPAKGPGYWSLVAFTGPPPRPKQPFPRSPWPPEGVAQHELAGTTHGVDGADEALAWAERVTAERGLMPLVVFSGADA